MTPHRQSLYTLAENLGRMVWELDAMPTSEYMGWIQYHTEKAKQQDAEDGNLLAMDAESMSKGFTGG